MRLLTSVGLVWVPVFVLLARCPCLLVPCFPSWCVTLVSLGPLQEVPMPYDVVLALKAWRSSVALGHFQEVFTALRCFASGLRSFRFGYFWPFSAVLCLATSLSRTSQATCLGCSWPFTRSAQALRCCCPWTPPACGFRLLLAVCKKYCFAMLLPLDSAGNLSCFSSCSIHL